MLIVPLHRVPGRTTVAWCTFALMLVNLFVFVVAQSGDDRVRAEALAHYVESGLADIEPPAYARYLEASGQRRTADELAGVMSLPEPARSALLSQRIDLDPAFHDWAAAHGFSGEAALLEWQAARSGYEAVKSRSTTERHMLRGNEIDPLRMFTAAFLHGDLGHLLGNLVFLFLVGHLVEAALGAWRYLVLYAVAAFGASAAALAWRWGEPSAGLGASGAIAGLMGAYCVLWGRRKVHFFYWFFVYFDYIRAPAIWLLPAWLGWELVQMMMFSDAGVGFEAHAGGLVTGALVALAMKHAGGGLDASRLVLSEDIEAARPEPQLETVLQALGRMELDTAESRLRPVLASHPDWLPARIAHYRVARYRGHRADAQARLDAALSIPCTRNTERLEQAEVLRDGLVFGLQPAAGIFADLATRLLDAGERAAARQVLESIPGPPGIDAPVAAAWLRLALAGERAGEGDYRSVLALIVQRFPDTEQAGKARFLLEQG